jgi:hypothetical protein
MPDISAVGAVEGTMSDAIKDPDVQLLAAVAATLKQEYIVEGAVDPWEGSPFAWIRTLKSRRVGKVGEQLVAGWCAAKGFDVTRSPDGDADRIIGGRRMEIKFSTLWESGIYNFQQIRDQNYEYAVCLGLSPFSAGCWVIPKQVLLQRLPVQHGGARGSDTRWLQFPASNPPGWLAQYGGALAQAYQALRTITDEAHRTADTLDPKA